MPDNRLKIDRVSDGPMAEQRSFEVELTWLNANTGGLCDVDVGRR
jgi:hypothetical protein